MRRIAPTALLAGASLLILSSAALAAWGSNGSGPSYAKARSLPAPAAPTTSVTGRNVTVSWTAPGGSVPITGYLVKRYNGSDVEQTVLADCTGTIATTSCTEKAVPAGSWRYTVTAARGNWRGGESPKSATVNMTGPSLDLSPTTMTSLPTTLSGSLAQFASGQTVTYRLDNPTTGTVLSGATTPSMIPTNGTASITVTIPSGTTNGSHTVYAIGSAGDQASKSITVDTPTITTSVLAKSAGGEVGFIGASKTYYVYGNVTGSGNPPAGLASLTANVSNFTPGTTAAPMTFGSYTIGGVSYNYRSAQLTSGSSITAGSKTYSLTATDNGGSTQTKSFSATADITAPSASDVQTTNVSGGTTGKAEAGDTIVLTNSEQIDANSVLAGWTGASTPVVVRLNDGINDSVQIYNAANSAVLPLGTIDMGRIDYTTLNSTFGASGTPSTMVQSGTTITITLGTQGGGLPTTALGTGRMSWTPSGTATDRAGNAASTTAATEGMGNDRDF
jgi:hypothetical protein